VVKNFAVLNIFVHGIFIETFLHLKPTVWCPISTLIFDFCFMEGGLYKYPMNKYMTPYCGLEVQKPTKALKSVNGPGNTFDLSPKWSRSLPSLIYLFMGYL
jgi:hypothetical protein